MLARGCDELLGAPLAGTGEAMISLGDEGFGHHSSSDCR
jgi:hypothetical protein